MGYGSNMEDSCEIVALMPPWAPYVGMIARMNAQLRSTCCECGTQFRENPAALAALLGAAKDLRGYRERCRKVACHGSVTFKVARSYCGPWISLDRVAVEDAA
jgi:hypothetical protein